MNKKVIVLEDEENIRKFVVINLGRAGYETVEFERGEPVIEYVKNNDDAAIAILDVMLPGIGGFDVCRRIRGLGSKMGIIMLTAMGQEADEGFKKSLELIIKQYDECLERFGVKPFAERGDAFDPNIHNAVMHVEDDSLEGNVVAEVLLKGYMFGERVVRHAMVKVAN